MSYYEKHVFFCANQKDEGKKCCGASGGLAMSKYAKSRLIGLGLHGAGKVRLSNAGCLGRCELGPCVVIYPEGVWYTYSNQGDVDEIIEAHIVNQHVAEHLLIDEKPEV